MLGSPELILPRTAFNPAVTFALYLIGNLTIRRAAITTFAQLAGGIAGAWTARGLSVGTFGLNNTTVAGLSNGKALAIEMFTTAFLCFTVRGYIYCCGVCLTAAQVMMLAAEKSKR